MLIDLIFRFCGNFLSFARETNEANKVQSSIVTGVNIIRWLEFSSRKMTKAEARIHTYTCVTLIFAQMSSRSENLIGLLC